MILTGQNRVLFLKKLLDLEDSDSDFDGFDTPDDNQGAWSNDSIRMRGSQHPYTGEPHVANLLLKRVNRKRFLYVLE